MKIIEISKQHYIISLIFSFLFGILFSSLVQKISTDSIILIIYNDQNIPTVINNQPDIQNYKISV